MALFNTNRIWFFDARGEYFGKKGFSKHQKYVKYSKGAYNISFQDSSFKEDNPLPFGIWKRRTYFYNIDNPNPIKLDKKAEPLISPELYNVNLETNVAKQLNDLAKKGLMDFINPKTLIILGVLAAVAIYFLQGGKLW